MNDESPKSDQTSRFPKRTTLRVALLVGASAALFFFLVFAKGHAPASVVNMLSSDTITELSLHGGSRIELRVAQGDSGQDTTAEVAEAMRSRGAVVAHAKNSKVTLELAKFDVAAASAWARRTASGGKLSMHMVIEDSEFMKTAYGLARESGEAMGITADIDQWTHDETGTRYVDYYLLGDTREILVAAVKHWLDTGALVLPPGTIMAYEAYDPTGYQTRAGWRSYLLNSTEELAGEDVDDASVYWNEYTNKPEVLIEFSREGGVKFANLTGDHIGQKVAILLDGDINSAPIIQDRIAGGSTSISMGGNDAQTMQAEAMALASLLGSPILPAKVDIVSVEAVLPQASNSKMLLARLLMALGAGLSLGLLAMLLSRVAPLSPVTPVAARPKGERPWFATLRPLLVSLGGVAAVLLLGTLWLPGTEELAGAISLTSDGATPTSAVAELSWVAVGLGPFLLGAVLAEGVAFLIPPWRRRRGGGTARRAPIDNLALALGLALLAAQAFFISSWLASLAEQGYVVTRSLSQPEFGTSSVLMALLGGSALLYLIAKLISRYGLGNGYAVVIFAGMVPLVPDLVEHLGALSATDALGFVRVFLCIAVALLVSASLVTRSIHTSDGRWLALPSTGVAPLLIGPAIGGVILIASRAGNLSETLMQAEEYLQSMQLVGVVVASLLILGFALRRPMASSQTHAVPGGKAVKDPRSLATATVVALAFPLGLYYIMQAINEVGFGMVIPLSMLVLAPSFTLDLLGEFRARFRNPDLVPVWELQRPRYLLPITGVLAHARIDCFVRGRYLRTLLSVVGPFVPMVIMVPRDKASEARELIQGQI